MRDGAPPAVDVARSAAASGPPADGALRQAEAVATSEAPSMVGASQAEVRATSGMPPTAGVPTKAGVPPIAGVMTKADSPGFLGVLMLDTRFPRPPGDIGNAETFRRHGIEVRYEVVRGASARRVVEEADAALLQPFLKAARRLVEQGATMISTSCGFLAAYQGVMAQALPVPVMTSALLACREFSQPGIVTFDATALTPHILRAAGVAESTPVQGVEPGCEFHRRILDDDTQLDLDAARRNVVDAASRLIERFPSVEDIVLECTNMPPYRDAIEQATGRRVHDIETLLVARWRAARPAD